MRRTTWMGLALTVAVLSGCASGYNVFRSGHEDFEGAWRRNDASSDVMDRTWLRESGGYGTGDTRDRDTGTPGWRLPYEMRIDADGDRLRITERDGTVIEQIVLDDRYGTGNENVQWRRGAVTVRGRWNGRDRLEVTTVNPMGVTIDQTLTLEGRGDRLVVDTSRRGDRRTREFRWVYDRV